ncbi:MAG: DMT family transporter [Candidatus Puniceispirillaceae bacterium]
MANWFWHSPHLLLTSATLSWAGHAIGARIAVGEVSPLLLMQLRWLFCFLILFMVFSKQMRLYWPIVRQRWRYVALMGGGGLAGFTALFSLGAQHTTAVNLGITQGAIPAFVMLFGTLLFGTRIGRLQFLGLLVSLCGVVVLITGGQIAMLLTLTFNIGDILMIAACFCYALYVLHLGKRLEMPPIIMVAYFSGSAFVALTLFTIGEVSAGKLVQPSLTGMAVILYCAIFPSILSQTFFMRGVELIGATRAGLYVNLVPVFAAFMAMGILSEPMYGYHIMALIMVVAGIALAEKHKVTMPA